MKHLLAFNSKKKERDTTKPSFDCFFSLWIFRLMENNDTYHFESIFSENSTQNLKKIIKSFLNSQNRSADKDWDHIIAVLYVYLAKLMEIVRSRPINFIKF